MIKVILLLLIVISGCLGLAGLCEVLFNNYASFLQAKRKHFKFLKDFFEFYKELDYETLQKMPPEVTKESMYWTKERLIRLEYELSNRKRKIKSDLIFVTIFGSISITLLIIYDFAFGGNVIKTILEAY